MPTPETAPPRPLRRTPSPSWPASTTAGCSPSSTVWRPSPPLLQRLRAPPAARLRLRRRHPAVHRGPAPGAAADVHGDGRQRRAFTYIDDVVAANLAAAAAPAAACRARPTTSPATRTTAFSSFWPCWAEIIGRHAEPPYVAARRRRHPQQPGRHHRCPQRPGLRAQGRLRGRAAPGGGMVQEQNGALIRLNSA